ncbi:phosphoribosylformylglycinamidine synthase isoform X2 [Carcharodon carcharias]|uniref:phosphoribosylformylglycinamidine synthase isoform X2 n=1 Tax=Carcharodon carcharias TaxID=13397 RepID=UPI001B7E9D7C|nr:phosphoribosylformylglycinamidine synthase isoform X2 [Carcharodon carcharias]
MVVLHFYRSPTEFPLVDMGKRILRSGNHHMERIEHVSQELCFNVNWTGLTSPSPNDRRKLTWLFQPPFNSQSISTEPFLTESDGDLLVEIGPRLNFSTAWSTNAVSICQSIGLIEVDRIECSHRYLLKVREVEQLGAAARCELMAAFYDRMTECVYERPIESFQVSVRPAEVYEVDVVNGGKSALEKANRELGLAFDAWDLEYYTRLFQKVGRNPSSVECFDLAQSNSEHSRHWFFKGRLVIDGEAKLKSLFDLIMKTQDHSNKNNVIKFSDNSSAITGKTVNCLYPRDQLHASKVEVRKTMRHVIFTAETHNFPTGVAPFSGATTGTGGRIRDVQCTGRGAHTIAGTAGYCFGNLLCPGYEQPWEDQMFTYPRNFARPLEVAIEASNGASDYGNKFGEPVLAGFARSFGMLLPNLGRREWLKPVMFSAGIGTIEDLHISKEQPEQEMEVVKIGGPVYRIGMGGGAASSIQVQGDNTTELDFGAVQRGDAEMEQKMNRALRACIESQDNNPICSIHDQGAGGNGNVLKELSEPAGAMIYTSKFKVGDPTLSVLELWGAEYQETNALLMRSKDSAFLRAVCDREKCPVDFVGKITGDGKIVLVDDRDTAVKSELMQCTTHPVDLKLEWVLGKMPQKEFILNHTKSNLQPLALPTNLTVRDALNRVLRLPSVASKRYLTNKVDRSVTGLVAQQQCVGPLHTPLADVAVVALSYFDTVGAATAIGEQPIKGLIDPGAGARMAIGEALTNLVFARVNELRDVKCSANWMWPAKLPGEGAALYDACEAMCLTLSELGVAVDGGKDSLSMAARVGQETVKAPGSLVISVYAVCPDITCTVTPDLKNPHGQGVLLYVPVNPGQYRMGGGALAQCYLQIGSECPDMDSPHQLASCFAVTQQLLEERMLSAGHDVSDGGLLTCLLEMAIAGNYGMEIDISNSDTSVIELLFSEELGLVLEVSEMVVDKVSARYRAADLQCWRIGSTTGQGPQSMVKVQVNGEEVLLERIATLRSWWEETSFQLERLQSNWMCVEEEERGMEHRTAPQYKLSFQPAHQPSPSTGLGLSEPRVAVIREEGSNGDREMVASLIMAGFQVWDVTMTDICSGMTLDSFRGVVFVGGFSYADVLGSAKGWAATVQFNPAAHDEFSKFRSRQDTFSLGVCNGCQLMALLGWVASEPDLEMLNDGEMHPGVLLTHNRSRRFESRFVTVTILESSSILLRGMEGSTLGIWVAHGEGYMQFESDTVLRLVTESNLAPLRYCDDSGVPTEQYPQNPNGSPLGIAALCSADGRHLAMMPHPERCTLLWQWPWMPQDWRQSLDVSPWLRMFQNAHKWCLQSL